MIQRNVRWTRRALRRLDQIGSEIAKDNPDAAVRVVSRLATAVTALRDHPAIGRLGRITGTREFVFADIPYIVAYRVEDDMVEVLTVIHTSRKWLDVL